MKILYTITDADIGGAQSHVRDLCVYGVSRGYDVAVMSSKQGWLRDEVTRLGCTYIESAYFKNSYRPSTIWGALRQVDRVVEEWKPDIVHCHSSFAGLVTRLAVRNRVRTIYTAHGWGFNIGTPWFQKIVTFIGEKITARFTEKIICVSEFVKNLGTQYRVISEEKCVVVYNGVKTRDYIEKINKEKIHAIFVGRLAEPKIPELVLEAIASSEVCKKNIVLEIVGSGPKYAMLVQKIRDLGLENHVRLVGKLSHDETLERLRSADVGILISRYEGLPLSCMESMAEGVPVIVSNVGGVSELVIDGVNGVLVENTRESVARALETVSEDRNRLVVYGKEAWKTMQVHTLERMYSALEKIYLSK
jgi:glycosyltransferase involved in cell wall biosynthesis